MSRNIVRRYTFKAPDLKRLRGEAHEDTHLVRYEAAFGGKLLFVLFADCPFCDASSGEQCRRSTR